jgi:threonylcarbamoyladenosine tRNA methylthiotransferase CDKAL1
MKLCVVTNGCGRRNAEKNIILFWAKQNGHEIVDKPEKADEVICITCAFDLGHEEWVKKFLNTVDRSKTILTGCFPDICPSYDLSGFKKIVKLDQMMKGIEEVHPLEKIKISSIQHSQVGDAILIARGCMNKCAYCGVKNATGNLRSVSLEEIIKQAEAVWGFDPLLYLFAEDSGAWGQDIQSDFSVLLRSLYDLNVQKFGGKKKIEIDNTNPRWFVNFYDCIKDFVQKGFINRIVIAMQSFSPSLLTKMNRKPVYDMEDLKKKILDLMNLFNHTIGMGGFHFYFLVGFPSETEEEFLETLEFSKKIASGVRTRNNLITVFKFHRKETVNIQEPDLPNEIVSGRAQLIEGVFQRGKCMPLL